MKKAVKPAKKQPEQIVTASMVANPRHAYARNRIATLDARLGAGIGATRERARLAKILAN